MDFPSIPHAVIISIIEVRASIITVLFQVDKLLGQHDGAVTVEVPPVLVRVELRVGWVEWVQAESSFPAVKHPVIITVVVGRVGITKVLLQIGEILIRSDAKHPIVVVAIAVQIAVRVRGVTRVQPVQYLPAVRHSVEVRVIVGRISQTTRIIQLGVVVQPIAISVVQVRAGREYPIHVPPIGIDQRIVVLVKVVEQVTLQIAVIVTSIKWLHTVEHLPTVPHTIAITVRLAWQGVVQVFSQICVVLTEVQFAIEIDIPTILVVIHPSVSTTERVQVVVRLPAIGHPIRVGVIHPRISLVEELLKVGEPLALRN